MSSAPTEVVVYYRLAKPISQREFLLLAIHALRRDGVTVHSVHCTRIIDVISGQKTYPAKSSSDASLSVGVEIFGTMPPDFRKMQLDILTQIGATGSPGYFSGITQISGTCPAIPGTQRVNPF